MGDWPEIGPLPSMSHAWHTFSTSCTLYLEGDRPDCLIIIPDNLLSSVLLSERHVPEETQ